MIIVDLVYKEENILKSVCAVLVTYNRIECLKKVIKGLEQQTHPISRIFVFNNASTDETLEYLLDNHFKQVVDSSELGKLDEQDTKIVFNSKENLGGSGGFAKAIGYAENFNYDYIWIMDDDVLPESNCLELLLKTMRETGTQVALPSRNDANHQDFICEKMDFSNFLKYCPYSQKIAIQYPLKDDYYFVGDMPFEGPLVETKLASKVGVPNAGFFLEYDDSDYAQRLLKYSKIVYVTHAILHRQLAKKGQQRKLKRDRYTWRTYYTLRNNIIFERKYGENWLVRNVSPRLLLIHKTVKSILDGYAKNNLPLLFKAYSDGIHGRMGKRVSPNY